LVDEPIANAGPDTPFGFIENNPHGVVEERATPPFNALWPVTVSVPPVLIFAPMVVTAKTEAAPAKRAPERRARRRGGREDFKDAREYFANIKF